MRSGGNILNYFTENQLTKFSAVCEMFSLEFGHTLSVGLLVCTGRGGDDGHGCYDVS